jgi:hypothetical protein
MGFSLLFNAVFAIKRIHQLRINEDQDDEYIDRTVLSHPEPEVCPANRNAHESGAQNNAKTERANEPDNE